MATIVDCPACGRKLRVPDELIEELVRCPTCGDTFTTQRVSEQPPPAPPPPVEPAPQEAAEGIQYDEEPEPLQARPKRYRKPHRAIPILILGILSICTGCFGIILGPIAWGMANNDLHDIRQGLMDPEGTDMINGGRVCGIIGTFLAVSLACCCPFGITFSRGH